jgi:LPXTG-site transpeptidase (sortase) family protein
MLIEKEKLLTKLKKDGVRYLGILLFLTGFTFLALTFYPVISSYIDYYLFPSKEEINVDIVKEGQNITKEIKKETEEVLLDANFGIYIPKIKANAPVIANVDPNNENAYTNALYKGVAHAKGTSTPDTNGNIFLFAHSAVNFYEQRKFNVYFYLLTELQKDDPIYVSYKNVIYQYKVLDIKKVDPTETKYLGKYMNEDTLTIMTCWPAGTDYKRIIVTAIRAQE